MKLSGCVELTLNYCTVNLSTSVSDLKPEIGCFSQTGNWKDRNRKSKRISSESSRVFVMRVLSSFFDFSILVAARIIFVRVYPYTVTQETKFFKSLWRLPCSKYQKSRIVLTQQNFTLFSSSTFSTSGFDDWNFRFQKNNPLPVWHRKPKSKMSRCIISRSTL